MLARVCAGVAAFVVAFTAVIVGWALSLDYSAKLFTMTFVLVIMGSERASGRSRCTASATQCQACHAICSWGREPLLQGGQIKLELTHNGCILLATVRRYAFVVVIAHPCGMYADAYLVALTRISGIVGGVFVMLLLSVIILPKSASHEVPQRNPFCPRSVSVYLKLCAHL